MPDLQVWGQALTNMPRLNHSQWRALDPVAKWLVATRASVLFMTFTAAVLGGLLAWRAGNFSWQPWLAATLGLLFAHATNNLLNDLSDFHRGIDRDNYYRNRYGVHVLEQGLMSIGQFRGYLVFTGGTALLLGAWLVRERSGLTFDLMLAGAFFVLFYTWPLKYYGLGEPAVLLVWGPLMVGGTYYVTAGTWSWAVCWVSLVFALGPTTVIFGKHIDKLEDDRHKGVHSLPVIVGDPLARRLVTAMLGGQYLLTVALVVTGTAGWPLLLVLLSLPRLLRALRALRSPKPSQRPPEYPESIWPLWFSAFAFGHTRVFTGLFLAGMLVDALLG